MNTLIKEIEFYNIRHGQYPESLKRLNAEMPSANIWDPISNKGSRNLLEFHYERVDKHYYLFSNGLDLTPYTGDDLYPTIDHTGLGLFEPVKK